MRILLALISLIVPRPARPRWREEWLAELSHGGWRMLAGALPDAWTLRGLQMRGSWLSPLAGSARPKPFHAINQDVRYALRSFGNGKSFTFAVVCSLAIGIGATTSGFALADALFFRPFAGVENPDTLVQVKVGNGRIWTAVTWHEYEELGATLSSLKDLAASHESDVAVSVAGGAAQNMKGAVVSGNYFHVLGVSPLMGRFFEHAETRPSERSVAVISHRFWQRHLSGDPGVVGQTITVNGGVLTVVGVAPEGFTNVPSQSARDVWLDFGDSDLLFARPDGQAAHVRDAGPVRLDLVGRLRDGTTLESAAAEATVTGEPLIAARGRNARGLAVRVEPLRPDDAGTYAARAAALMAVPLIVLAIACVNAANLLLARATSRSMDWLVRLALGASRWRLIRQVLVESTILAIGGTLLGLVLCSWMFGLQSLDYEFTTPSIGMLMNVRVLFFSILATVGTALVFGLGPAMSVTRAAISRAPEAGRFMRGPFGSRTRSLLVVVQTALCLGLLATGAQFTNTLRQSLDDDNLVDPAHVLITSIDLGGLRFTDQQMREFYERTLERIRRLPGVQAVGTTEGGVHLFDAASSVRIWNSSGADGAQSQMGVYAGGDFFAAMRLPILRGRAFAPQEERGPVRAVVVNEAFAASLTEPEPLGRVLRIGASSGDYAAAHDAVIVGIVPSPKYSRGHTHPIIYYPTPLGAMPAMDLIVRFQGDAQGIIAAVSSVIGSIDNRVPVKLIVTGEELRRRRNAPEILLAGKVSVLGLLGLVLAAAGLYGVVSYMVTLRRKEIGIRMALGAAGASVRRLILRQSIVPVIIGSALGAVGAVAIARVIRSHLYGVSPFDPLAFGAAAGLLLAVMVVASLVPARRASRVDPVEVLRQE